jgi:hypothetical protein
MQGSKVCAGWCVLVVSFRHMKQGLAWTNTGRGALCNGPYKGVATVWAVCRKGEGAYLTITLRHLVCWVEECTAPKRRADLRARAWCAINTRMCSGGH